MQMRKNLFTMFELIISVGLLVIISVILMKTFILTSDFWKYSADQSQTFIDAKIVMNMLNEDISNALYETSPSDQADEIVVPLYAGSFTPTGYTVFKDNNYNDENENKNIKGWCLGLVTRTAGSDRTLSNICKVAYVYYPPSASGNVSDLNENKVPGRNNGVLLRGEIAEDTTDYLKMKSGETLQNFYQSAMNSATQLADCIVEFKIEPYSLSGSSFSKKSYTSADSRKGLSNVKALQLSMTLLSQDKFDEYKKLPYASKIECEDRKAFLHKHGRKFTRTFWLKTLNE